MHHFILYLSVLSIISPCITAAPTVQSFPLKPGQCKPTPGDTQWPSEAEWSTLNSTIQGRLLRPTPPAAACHPGRPEFNNAACDAVKKGFADSDWHVGDPVSNMWQNWNNYSCTLTADAECSGKGYPIFVVAAKEPEDVAQAVKFARRTGVRGRSVQPNSLSIWTHGLKNMKWFDTSFSPTGCRAVIDGPALSIGAGNQWGEINAAAKAKDPSLAIVGAAFDSVSAGGYLSNGGHGPLSAKYGLGADMVLQIELVTAEGEIITANECQNEDYFWAMRGGGGSTYGVALSYVVQALKISGVAKFKTTVKGWDELLIVHSRWPAIAAAGGGGYISGYPGAGSNISVSVSLPNATSAQLQTLVDPIMETIRLQREKVSQAEQKSPAIVARYTDHPTWEVVQRHADDILSSRSVAGQAAPFHGMGQSKTVASWLWSAEDVAKVNLKEALVGALEKDVFYLNDAVMGVGTHKPPFMRGGGNGVNPAFRTAIMRPAAELEWAGTDRAELVRRSEKVLKLGLALKSLNPGGGTYANEADPNVEDWQHAFWGNNGVRFQLVFPTPIWQGPGWYGLVNAGQYISSNGSLITIPQNERERVSSTTGGCFLVSHRHNFGLPIVPSHPPHIVPRDHLFYYGPFPFMGLPVELREMVYQNYANPWPDLITLGNRVEIASGRHFANSDLRLLRVCQAFHQEARKYVLRNKVFSHSCYDSFHRFSRYLNPTNPMCILSNWIRVVELDLNILIAVQDVVQFTPFFPNLKKIRLNYRLKHELSAGHRMPNPALVSHMEPMSRYGLSPWKSGFIEAMRQRMHPEASLIMFLNFEVYGPMDVAIQPAGTVAAKAIHVYIAEYEFTLRQDGVWVAIDFCEHRRIW
ncbi:hypothetical protein EG327_006624 [Venturia inaequalis]|uniref:FAD-binding PCMH-type domain-containing protein n=1 Tax=Venturia inaequalis TaxID=5025 RepID=A0A8H3V401_VENIN|nr:hypothetical protein EG327_006624 [Venturia inaequalis]